MFTRIEYHMTGTTRTISNGSLESEQGMGIPMDSSAPEAAPVAGPGSVPSSQGCAIPFELRDGWWCIFRLRDGVIFRVSRKRLEDISEN